MPLLKASATSDFPKIGATVRLGGLPVLATDAEEKLLLFEGLYLSKVNASVYGLPSYEFGMFSIQPPVSIQSGSEVSEPIIAGDSGDPMFVIWDGGLALVSLFTYSTAGMYIPGEVDVLKAVGIAIS